MANLLITGANGQVGQELRALAPHYPHVFFFTDHATLDITDLGAIEHFISTHDIEVIINAAAYTAVDRAETEPEHADAINHRAIAHLASLSKHYGITLIHISTDYIFDDPHRTTPYREDETPSPQSIYGQSKLAGENALRAIAPDHSLIVRTSWVYSPYGNNFVKTMLRLGRERQTLGVVNDQIGSPTYAYDLARTLFELIPHLTHQGTQTYHYTNEGSISWYTFAQAIMHEAKLPCTIHPITTAEYPTPAKRPSYSVLDTTRIRHMLGLSLPHWRDSLRQCLHRLGEIE